MDGIWNLRACTGNKYLKEINPMNMKGLTKSKQILAYKYSGYWKCMDNLNEKNQLEEIFKKKKTIWSFK